jgi:hypothetical protein
MLVFGSRETSNEDAVDAIPLIQFIGRALSPQPLKTL